MKKIIKLWNKCDYNAVYNTLKEKEYDYTIENLEKDFSKVNSMNKFCYLIYLLSRDYSVKNTLLVCDFLIYTDTFFYDIYSVIRMIVSHAVSLFPTEHALLEWIVLNYENHPDSPFTNEEIEEFKSKL